MQKKIKVLVVDGIYPPAYTGSGLRAHSTYKRLSSKYPVEFAVLTTTQGGFKSGPDEYDGIRIYRTKANKSLLSQVIQVSRSFKKYDLHKFDIVHGFGDSLVVIAASLLAKYYSLKLIHEITVLSPVRKKSIVRIIKDSINILRFGYARKITYRKADLLIAINESIKQYYLRQDVTDTKIWIRPNPVDTKKYFLPDERLRTEIRKELSIPNDKTVVLEVGRIEPRKNQKFAIEVIRLLPDNFVLLIVGPSDNSVKWYLGDIQEEVRNNGFREKVKVFPEYRTDIEKFYFASDMVWIPSHSEGTPNAMLEALCCGLPVLVNRSLQLEMFITDGSNGYNLDLQHYTFSEFTIKTIEMLQKKDTRFNIAQDAISKFGSEKIDYEHYRYLLKGI
jgi:glycosyltransferase involved in cell wall biosynthesis